MLAPNEPQISGVEKFLKRKVVQNRTDDVHRRIWAVSVTIMAMFNTKSFIFVTKILIDIWDLGQIPPWRNKFTLPREFPPVPYPANGLDHVLVDLTSIPDLDPFSASGVLIL